MSTLSAIRESANFLREQGIDAPEVGIVLGTGLANLATRIEVITAINYADIPHFPIATVEFHKGRLVYGILGGKKVVALQGRYHYYEGYSMQQIVHPVRVMKLLGVKYVLLSNAAGAIHPEYKKGELMLIDDHINLQPDNPLRGINDDELGVRFPDMSQPYDARLNAVLNSVAAEQSLTLHTGVYASVMGPNLETRAEYRYLRTIGADAVGMSTVPEVIACNHMGLPCAAVSVLTDECDPDNLKPVDIAEIIAIAGKAEVDLADLLEEVIARVGEA